MIRVPSVPAWSIPALFVLIAAPVAACSASGQSGRDNRDVAATGTGTTRHYPATGFTNVGLGGGGDVEVRVGPAFSVTATGTPEALDRISVRRDGDGLGLGWKPGIHWGDGATKVHYVVTMPRIAGASIGGAGSIAIDRVEGDAFAGSIGGSGRIDVRAMRVNKASFAVGGSGDIAATGTTRDLDVSIGGSGRVLLQPLHADTADLTIAGAGSIDAQVARTADVTIMGSGNVTVTGGAKCSVTKMGAGTVRCG